jgi:GNAT superfamily N-acetyltransferase
VRLRFFGFQRAFPEEYADALLAGRPEEHDAVLAYPDPHHGDGAESLGSPAPYADGDALPVGLASLAAVPGAGPPAAELGVLVCDGWQRQGVGSALVAALIARARERGVVAVSASVLPGRTALLRAMTHRLATLGLVAPPPPAHEPPIASPPPAAPVSYAWTDGSLTAVYRLSEPFPQGRRVPQGRRASRPGRWHSSRQEPSPYA